MNGDWLIDGLSCLVNGVRLTFQDGSWILSFCDVNEVVEGSMLNPPFERARDLYLDKLVSRLRELGAVNIEHGPYGGGAYGMLDRASAGIHLSIDFNDSSTAELMLMTETPSIGEWVLKPMAIVLDGKCIYPPDCYGINQ